MAIRKHGNNLRTYLLNNVTASGTSLIVNSVAGFPTIGAGEVYRVTLSQNNSIEIVEVTSVSVNTLTVTRGMEGTSGKPFTNGAIVELRATADSYDRKQDLLDNTTTATVTPASTDRVLIQDASDSYKLKNVLFSSFGGGGGGGSGDVVGPASATTNTVALFDGTTGKLLKSMTAPAADRIIFYDVSASTIDYLTLGTNLSISGTTLNAAGGGGGGSQTPWTGNIDTAGYTLTNTSTSTGVKISNTNQPIILEGSHLTIQRTAGYGTSVPVRLYEGPLNGSDYITLRAPDSLSSSYNFILPDNAPTNGYYLKTDGTKTFWASVPSGVPDGIYADIVVSGSGTSWKLNTSLITLANNDRVVVQDVSASNAAAYVLVTDIAQFATKLGTIATGVWQGTAVGTAYGGTGQTTYTNGQLLIGNTTGNTLTKGAITAGNGINITNGPGTISIASELIGFRAELSANQTVASGPNVKIQLNTKTFDTNSFYDDTTNFRFKPTVAGKYLIMLNLGYDNAGVTVGQARIHKNGNAVAIGYTTLSGSFYLNSFIADVVSLNGTTDYVEAYGYHGTAPSRAVLSTSNGGTFFSAQYIGL